MVGGITQVFAAVQIGIPSEIASSVFWRSSVVYEGMMNQLSHLEVWILDCGRCCDMLLMQESCRFIA